MKLKVNIKKVSGKQNEIAQMELECPENIRTVRELLTETVKFMVADYKTRMKRGEEFLTVLTDREIEEKGVSGKIGFGIIYGTKKPNLEKSIQAALECFTDGMVVLFVDGVQYEEPEEEIPLQEGSELTFVRMIPLAGRMW